MKIGAFVIHLARATQRRDQVARILAACPAPAEVLDAVDGRALSAEQRAAVYVTDLHRPHYPYQIGAGEIGCFLSHRAAWQAILDSGMDAGLVLEDDVEIDRPAFEKALALAADHVGAHGIVQFQVRDLAEKGARVAEAGGVALWRPDIVPLRMSCTLYSTGAARRLIELTERFDRPVDGIVQMTWLTGLFPLIAAPSGVSERSAAIGGTTIQQTAPPLAQLLRREALRPFYRLQIRRYSRRALAERFGAR